MVCSCWRSASISWFEYLNNGNTTLCEGYSFLLSLFLWVCWVDPKKRRTYDRKCSTAVVSWTRVMSWLTVLHVLPTTRFSTTASLFRNLTNQIVDCWREIAIFLYFRNRRIAKVYRSKYVGKIFVLYSRKMKRYWCIDVFSGARSCFRHIELSGWKEDVNVFWRYFYAILQPILGQTINLSTAPLCIN